MSFDEWYIQNEIKTYDKTEYDCMKMAWNAAIEAAQEGYCPDCGRYYTDELEKLKVESS